MERPDHRRLGRELAIFANDELCGSGLPLWLPAGATVRAEIERFVVELERRNGYQHVYTPELAKRELYIRSGHWEHFRNDMYPPMQVGTEHVVLRPMNCPHHMLVFGAQRRSIRDLPVRFAELGTMFRYERSGVVGGLSRVRQMTLNDGHVFCAPDQLEAEIACILAMVEEAYRTLDIPAPRYRLSLRGTGPKYVDDDELWHRSEAVLRSALRDLGVTYEQVPGEAAFYGPKIDLQVEDPQGRQETLSTVQVDFHLPAQFDLAVFDGARRIRPVMIHGASCRRWNAWSPICSRCTTARSRCGWPRVRCGSSRSSMTPASMCCRFETVSETVGCESRSMIATPRSQPGSETHSTTKFPTSPSSGDEK